jgi:hypothetical protein
MEKAAYITPWRINVVAKVRPVTSSCGKYELIKPLEQSQKK